jgi:class 3 adenylate cyclase/tetratricopeptide (TPR) repeat protein
VTVLFCDLVGSTELAGRLGPEGMHVLLGRFFERALAEVHRYEGTVNQFLGDGFMALFGAPVAHEDHARRAALAALGIRRALAERPLEVEPGRPLALRLRMGLHTGSVVIGAIGDSLRMDYTAVGDTTHVAARLLQQAAPDAILLSEATARLVEGWVQAERVGPLALKGVAEPVVAWTLTGPGPRSGGPGPAAGRPLSPFVGRDRELDTLRGLLAAVEAGRGHAVGLVGEPGAGKSRLVLELGREVAGRPVDWLPGRCVSYGATIPYLPLLDVLRRHCALADADPPEAVAAKVGARLAEAGLPAARDLPYLLHLLGIKPGSEALQTLGTEAVKAGTFEALRQLVLRAARRRPLVLAVEDLHWVDRTSEEWLGTLAERLAGAHVLLLASYRPGYRPAWLEHSWATQLSLGPLGARDSLTVVRASLGPAEVPEAVAALVLARAEGNPFFLEELARTVADQGGGAAGLAIPETVQGVLAARIDRLPEPAKRVLQTAAVLGREFPVRLLAAVGDGEEPPDAHLRELARLEFLYERPEAEEPTYTFKHALTQDVAEATLLGPRRRELHRRAAEALERLYPERLPELAPVLAEHFAQAEAWGPAYRHARRAGEAARAAFANREALAHLDRALAAAERAGLDPGDRLAVHEARGDVHAVLGDFERARADLEAALGLAGAGGDGPARARLLGALAMLWGGHKDYERGLELSRQAVEAAEACGDRVAAGEARIRVGIMRTNQAQLDEAAAEVRRALAVFREAGHEGGQARAFDALAVIHMIAGALDEGVVHAEEAVRRLRALGDRVTEMSTLSILGAALAYRGDRAAGEARLQEALAGVRALGLRQGEAFAHLVLADALEPYGAYGRALREAEAGLAIAREIGHLEWTAASLSGVGRVRRWCGDVAGARRAHEEMLATTVALRTALWIADAEGELGADLLAAGERDAAAARLERAVAGAGEAREYDVRPRLALLGLALREGRAEEALRGARALQASHAPFRIHVADARRLEGEALAALGRREEAATVLGGAKAAAAALGAAPPRWRACLALAELQAAAGRRAEAAAERAEARALLERVAADLPADLRPGFEASEPVRRARASGG